MLYLIAIVGAVIITVALIKLLGGLALRDLNSAIANTELSEEERNAAIAKAYNPSGCVIMPVILVLFFGSAMLMLARDISLERSELENYGHFTLATVKNGSSFSTRRIDLSNIILGFKTDADDSVFVKHSVSAKEFSNFYKNETLPIIYSSRYPSILKIATSEEIDKYRR